MKKIIMSLCLVLVLVLCTTGCGKVAKLENGKDAVVTLKSGDIAVDDLYNELKEKYAVSILIDMIDRSILNKKYKTTDEENQNINSRLAQMKAQYEGKEAEFLTAIQQYFGVKDEEELKDLLHLDYKRSLAVEDYAKSLVSEKEINDYYEKKAIGDMKLSHILVKPVTNDSMTADEKKQAEEDALKKAKEIITRLNNGEKFEELAKELSDDTGTAKNGGNLDYVNRNSNLDEDFFEGAINLEKGKYTTTPVKSSFGYHIILKVDQKEKPKLDAIKDDILDTLKEEKLSNDSKLQYKALMELRKENKMEIQDDSLKSQYDKLMDQLLKQES